MEPREGMAELPLGCEPWQGWDPAGMGFPAQQRLLPSCELNLAAGKEGRASPQVKHLLEAFCPLLSVLGVKFERGSASVPRRCHWEHKVLHPSCTERILIRYLRIIQGKSGLCGAAGSQPAKQQHHVGSLKDCPVLKALRRVGQADFCRV